MARQVSKLQGTIVPCHACLTSRASPAWHGGDASDLTLIAASGSRPGRRPGAAASPSWPFMTRSGPEAPSSLAVHWLAGYFNRPGHLPTPPRRPGLSRHTAPAVSLGKAATAAYFGSESGHFSTLEIV